MVFKLVSLVVSPARADVHQQTLAGLASDLFRTTQALTSQAWRHHAPSRTPVARLGLQASRPNVHGRAFTPSKSEGAQTSSAPKSKPVTESARLALRFLRTATRTTATLSLLSLTSSLQGIELRHYHRHISSPETRIAAPRSASRLDSGKGADILSTCVITDRAPPWRHELRAGHGAPRIGTRTTVPCKRSVIHTPPTPNAATRDQTPLAQDLAQSSSPHRTPGRPTSPSTTRRWPAGWSTDHRQQHHSAASPPACWSQETRRRARSGRSTSRPALPPVHAVLSSRRRLAARLDDRRHHQHLAAGHVRMTARPDDRRHRQHLAAGPPAGSLDLYAALGPRPGHGAAAAALPQTGQPSPGAPQHAPRTPAPCPSRVETLRSPTCRTPGHLRCTRFGRSYARGHALRHQPAGPPRLLRPPRWLACWASEHAESGRTRTSLSLPPAGVSYVARRTRQGPRATMTLISWHRRITAQSPTGLGGWDVFWLAYEFRTTHCSMLTR